MVQQIETDRLLLRQWQKKDLAPFVCINQDSRVMRYFPSLLTEEETQQLIARINKHFMQYGFGLYACELKKAKNL